MIKSIKRAAPLKQEALIELLDVSEGILKLKREPLSPTVAKMFRIGLTNTKNRH
jgi:hypothetical protein